MITNISDLKGSVGKQMNLLSYRTSSQTMFVSYLGDHKPTWSDNDFCTSPKEEFVAWASHTLKCSSTNTQDVLDGVECLRS